VRACDKRRYEYVSFQTANISNFGECWFRIREVLGSVPAVDCPDLGFPSVFLSHTRHVPGWYLHFTSWPTPYRISQNLILEWSI